MWAKARASVSGAGPGQTRVRAEITHVRWGSFQPFSRDARSYTTPWATYGSTVLGYGSKHALWLWSAPSPTFEQMMHGPSSAPEAVRRVRHGGWRRREAVGGLAPASSGSWLVL